MSFIRYFKHTLHTIIIYLRDFSLYSIQNTEYIHYILVNNIFFLFIKFLIFS